MKFVTLFSLFIVLLFTIPILAQERLTVYYFGATSCGPCNRPEVVESIKKIKKQFHSIHKDVDTKFVMVCMDINIEEGLKFIQKYDYWDEISIGSHYDNELVLTYLCKTAIPGVPHILIYRDMIEENNGIKIIKTRNVVKDILGGEAIVDWLNKGLNLE